MKKADDLGAPITLNERYMHGVNVRLEILINQMSSLLEYVAQKEGIAVTAEVMQDTAPKRSKKVV